ncbi:MAG: D-alanyl-D-alanine carboxypeptidase [Rhodospirillales bacterium]|nr:D-alanyl-D-alanine carboxypeptidase [Rhodospirillales bacterium]
MGKIMKRLIYRLFVLALFLAPVTASQAATPMTTSAKQAIVIDYDTGMVLFEKDADTQMPTSSMSKVMTIYAVFDALKDGKISLDDTLRVSEKAWRKGGSKMFVEVGKNVKIEDLIRGVLIQSGNDATIVLAEGLAGTEEAFAEGLTAKARQLGMAHSHFMNASGWPDPHHYSTARDLATLSAAIIRDFPDYYHYFAEQEFTYNNIKQRNRNPLLYRDIGADGVKTGHTEIGGYGLMGAGVYNGRRVIIVVNGLPDEKARAQEGARLLEWGMKSFENVELFKAGETVENASVVMGKSDKVALTLAQDLKATVPSSVKNDLKVDVVYESPLEAPIAKGDKVAVLRVAVPRGETLEIPLLASQDVPRLGLVAGTLAKIKLSVFGHKEDEK